MARLSVRCVEKYFHAQYHFSISRLIRLSNLKKSVIDLCNHLPSTLLLPLSYTLELSLFREIQAESLLQREHDVSLKKLLI